ncbi:MAG: hypothetical protein CVV50_01445 [Spirochaetae bacterium HGW-Spirochaetae-6]|nr:MAG: hypothetical protein CVV50_01445 [Spirochaetae bacterium HGW-Spirochaetae-6]
MENKETKTIGQILTQTRAQKGVSLEEAASVTNISKRFLSALEEDNFDNLPAKIHVGGFVRLYGAFLGLNEIMLMERLEKQLRFDQHPPIQEIIELSRDVKRNPRRINPLVFITMGILILIIVFSLITLNQGDSTAKDGEEKVEKIQKSEEDAIVFDKETLIKKGEEFKIPWESGVIKFKLAEISESLITIIPERNEEGVRYLKKNEALRYDSNEDFFFDFKIMVNEVNEDSAVIVVQKIKEARLKDQERYSVGIRTDVQTPIDFGDIKAEVKNISTYPILVWEVEKGKDEERFTRLNPGQSVQADVLKNGMMVLERLDMSDISAVEFILQGKNYDFKKAGGAVGYIRFEMVGENGVQKMKWEAIYE